MKTIIKVSFAVILMMLTGCMQTRYITEKYIKTKIEKHVPNSFSTIRTYSIYKGYLGNSSYIELTGYKYDGNKALVIGADKYYLARQKFQGDMTRFAEISYLQLNIDEVNSILVNHEVLIKRIKKEKLKTNEEVYQDFTVNKELFISLHKTSASSGDVKIDFWIYGEKYSVYKSTIINKLEDFVKY
ncbi:MAG: hypothetical protein IPH57_10025 [Saprospiraceae bacterium]|nr:hypothetical protein [Saprospiraceae bacterium]